MRVTVEGFTKRTQFQNESSPTCGLTKTLITVSKKPIIRIVKKDDLSRAAGPETAPPTIPTEEDSARTMTKTVTGWIREFKERSDAEAGKMLAVFRDTTRPREA